MATMTMATPAGNKVSTRSKKVYAVVKDNRTATGELIGTCIFRTDSYEKALKRVTRENRWGSTPICWAYDTIRRYRVA